MKKLLFLIGIALSIKISAQGLTFEEKKILINEIRNEILDSLKKESIHLSDNDFNLTNKQKGNPFEDIDATWQNGSDRRENNIWKDLNYFTPSILLDINYTHSSNNPNDNTVIGSTALSRNNEVQLSALHFGGDLNYKNARARFMTQLGTRSIVVPRNDYSPYRGQYQLANAYRLLK